VRRLTYYVAATADGYIAGPDGEVDFFPIEADVTAAMNAVLPETVPTGLRAAVGLADAENRRFDTVLMGRATYDVARKAGVTSPYAHLKQYVFSRTLGNEDAAVSVVATEPAAFVRGLKAQAGGGIWLCGGGKLAGHLLSEIDELIIKQDPVVVGSGVPLFDGPFAPRHLSVVEVRTFESGVNVITYARDDA
jgi:dihydrofolate reductase